MFCVYVWCLFGVKNSCLVSVWFVSCVLWFYFTGTVYIVVYCFATGRDVQCAITVGQNRDASAATWNRAHDDRTQSRNGCPAKLLHTNCGCCGVADLLCFADFRL